MVKIYSAEDFAAWLHNGGALGRSIQGSLHDAWDTSFRPLTGTHAFNPYEAVGIAMFGKMSGRHSGNAKLAALHSARGAMAQLFAPLQKSAWETQ